VTELLNILLLLKCAAIWCLMAAPMVALIVFLELQERLTTKEHDFRRGTRGKYSDKE